MDKRLLTATLILILFLAAAAIVACDSDDDDDSADDDDDAADDDIADDDDDDTADDDDDDTADDDDDDTFIPPSPVYGYYEEAGGEGKIEWLTGQLPTFAEYDFTLFLGMDDYMIGDRDLLQFIQEADSQGVEIRAWVLLPYADGYWPGEENAEQFAESALGFADWLLENDLPIDWIVVDMEIPVYTLSEFNRLIGEGDYSGVLKILFENIDPAGFQQASQIYQQLNDDLHELGFYSMVVTSPMILDDLSDDDATIQDAMQTPVTTIEWDEVSTMVYTTTYEDYIPLEFGPYFVYDYALSTVEYYPDTASIALGVSNDMESHEDLAAEVAAAKAAGIERIQIYNYSGSNNNPDATLWHQALSAEPEVPEHEPATKLLRDLIQLADSIF